MLMSHLGRPDGKVVGSLPEQMPYQEWLHSDYKESKSCQSCHMPSVKDTAITRVLGGAREELAKHVAKNEPGLARALRAAKAAIRFAAGLPNALPLAECEALAAQCFDSADYMEGRAAFLEKRAPVFRGR